MGSITVKSLVTACAFAIACSSSAAFADDAASEAALAALAGARMTLLDGVRQAGAAGAPISGKFEMQAGKLSLSVYTAGKGVAVAPEDNVLQELSGSAKDGDWNPDIHIFNDKDHIERASQQLRVMSMSRESLADAIVRAQRTNGATVFSATPVLSDSKPALEMLLADKGKVRKVVQPL